MDSRLHFNNFVDLSLSLYYYSSHHIFINLFSVAHCFFLAMSTIVSYSVMVCGYILTECAFCFSFVCTFINNDGSLPLIVALPHTLYFHITNVGLHLSISDQVQNELPT